MNVKVGVISGENIPNQAIVETKKALDEIAMKYGCKFELTPSEPNSGIKNIYKESNLKAHLKSKDDQISGPRLSFGGEIDVD